ncbi:MAG: hypothetical protein Q7S34_01665 [bacterium]|nr:hypothetical protein [bacterium]
MNPGQEARRTFEESFRKSNAEPLLKKLKKEIDARLLYWKIRIPELWERLKKQMES